MRRFRSKNLLWSTHTLQAAQQAQAEPRASSSPMPHRSPRCPQISSTRDPLVPGQQMYFWSLPWILVLLTRSVVPSRVPQARPSTRALLNFCHPCYFSWLPLKLDAALSLTQKRQYFHSALELRLHERATWMPACPPNQVNSGCDHPAGISVQTKASVKPWAEGWAVS